MIMPIADHTVQQYDRLKRKGKGWENVGKRGGGKEGGKENGRKGKWSASFQNVVTPNQRLGHIFKTRCMGRVRAQFFLQLNRN